MTRAWAIQCEANNKLDGKRVYLAGRYYLAPPPEVEGCPVALFKTRKAARKFLQERFGYIRRRPDLQTEPHGWRMPRVVPVVVSVSAPGKEGENE